MNSKLEQALTNRYLEFRKAASKIGLEEALVKQFELIGMRSFINYCLF